MDITLPTAPGTLERYTLKAAPCPAMLPAPGTASAVPPPM